MSDEYFRLNRGVTANESHVSFFSPTLFQRSSVRYSTRSGRQCQPNRKYPVVAMLSRWQQRKEAEEESDTGPTEADELSCVAYGAARFPKGFGG